MDNWVVCVFRPMPWQTAVVTAAVILACISGCTRAKYRLAADRDAQTLIQTRQVDPRWALPIRPVEADTTSRMSDPTPADCGPLPPDDPAALGFQQQPYRFNNTRYWEKLGRLDEIETDLWKNYLPYDADGQVLLTRDNVSRLAFLNSRDYQTQIESLYLQSLTLSLSRFDLDTQWFGGFGSQFLASGDGANANRLLSGNSNFGFSRNLAGGGQLIANVANSLVWQLGPAGGNTAGGAIVVGLTQPLLRGAFEHVRLEGLTLQERVLLYAVRDFARFRRQFYFGVVTSYLSLVAQQQSLNNAELNLESLQRNLDEHQELLKQGMVSPIQVDQVFQQFQAGRLNVLSTRQQLQDAQDRFKVQLGLPPDLEVQVDRELLDGFILSDPKLDEIQNQIDEVYRELLKSLPPEVAAAQKLASTAESIQPIVQQLQKQLPEVQQEFARWEAKLKEKSEQELDTSDQLDFDLQDTLRDRIGQVLETLEQNLEADLKEAKKLIELTANEPTSASDTISKTTDNDAKPEDKTASRAESDAEKEQVTGDPVWYNALSEAEQTRVRRWNRLQRFIGRELRERIGSLIVAQTQIRLFLIELNELEVAADRTVDVALANRFDLMNAQAQVSDAARAVEVAADLLESNLTVNAQANLATDPLKDNPLRFDSSAASYAAGLQFDGPLNRFAERNIYRSAQIGYQQSRRRFMATHDQIVLEIRQDLRTLELSRRNFQISRQQLITAARQVEEAQLRLRNAGQGGDSSLTQDLLQALQGLLSARDNLISSWIGFETQRINLYVDTEQLQLDEQGAWLNESENFAPASSSLNQSDASDSPEPTNSPEPSDLPEPTDSSTDRSDLTEKQ